MKTAFIYLLPFLLLTACYTPDKKCSNFKTGVFEYQTVSNGELIKAKIVRNDSLEIDYFNEKEPDTSKIRWLNDCEYVLQKYHPENSGERQTFQMKIIRTDGESYTFKFSEVGKKKSKKFTAKRIKE